uniref:Uncharacterized protein n=1 Tax=Moniliophthora roreri TaxID=221103 RepID=A0A0W0FEX3_MONRR
MTQLVDCVSALCVDWSAILPEIAHSTCVSDASKLSLGILLEAALTTEGLAGLRVERLIRVLALCRTIVIMTMNLTTTSMENSDKETAGDNRDTDFMFIGSDPQKVGRFMEYLSVEERERQGWQPRWSMPVALVLKDLDDMPDTPHDYDAELYKDGES